MIEISAKNSKKQVIEERTIGLGKQSGKHVLKMLGLYLLGQNCLHLNHI